MSHGDGVTSPPPGFTVLASTPGAPVAAFEETDRRLAGVQFHPEVLHTAHGQQILQNFLYDVAGLRPTWTEANIIDDQVGRDPRPGRRRSGRCAGCRAASTPRLRRPWCSARSAIS